MEALLSNLLVVYLAVGLFWVLLILLIAGVYAVYREIFAVSQEMEESFGRVLNDMIEKPWLSAAKLLTIFLAWPVLLLTKNTK